MAIIKCKMCGGDLILEEGSNVAECEYCGSRQTVPSADNEKKLNLFARANRLRANNEFDKASGVYESIVADFPEEAEAYWGLILCKYGIEYVDDPATGKKIPTCHRSSFDSVMDDPNFELVMENADPIARRVYREEAKQLEGLRKGIIEVSSHEEPYDIFICYKETNDKGDRTLDSVLAQDVYDMLTGNGYRVFFSRVSLEDKLGVEYEPYIFAALNSAKIMLAFGTDYDYFNAVWVKNEWSRFLQLIAKGEKKTLIPCYKNIEAYDMPKEFAKLQAQDLGKVGANQDLLRGIKKILPKEEKQAASAPQQVIIQQQAATGPTVDNLLRRGTIFLEEKNWASAEEYFNKVLDIEAENGNAYLGLALTKAQCANLDAFVQKLAVQYTYESEETLSACKRETARIDALAEELAVPGYLTPEEVKMPFYFPLTYPSRETAARKNKDKTLSELRANRNYSRAVQYADAALKPRLTEAEQQVTSAFDKRIEKATADAEAKKADVLNCYKAHLKEQEQKAAERSKEAQQTREAAYHAACDNLQHAASEQEYRNAEDAFSMLSGYKDADARAEDARTKADEIKAETEQQRKEAEARARREAERKAKKKKLTAIIAVLVALALAAFLVVTKVIIPNIKYNEKYNEALKLYEAGKYDEAIAAFEALDGYKDSAEKAAECLFLKLKAGFTNVSVGSTIKFGFYEQDNNTSNGKEEIEWKVLAVDGNKALIISQYALDCKPYNDNYTDTTWKKCTLRTWLNGTFYYAAFDADHQKMIVSSTVTADKNPSYSTSPGNNTTDKVFLLSIPEVNKYFSSDEARRCAPTRYAIAQGAETRDSYKTGGRAACSWLLRSPGFDSGRAAHVSDDGHVYGGGYIVSSDCVAVRPAMWIDLEP